MKINLNGRSFSQLGLLTQRMNVLLTAGLLGLSLAPAQAQWRSDSSPPQINVSGSAEVKVAPDEVDLNVGVETRDADLQLAQRKNDEQVAASLAFLKKQGLPDKDIQTGFVAIEPNYEFSNRSSITEHTQPLYFVVRKDIGIKLTNLVTFDSVLTGLLANGVNSVHGIDFRSSELRKYKDQARLMAIKAAREKADAMASVLGVTVGKPLNISVNDQNYWPGWYQNGWGYDGGQFANAVQNVSQNGGGGPGGDGPTFAVGQISVSATVNVSFLIH
jgi:uncharacterized protein YggE